MNNINPYILGCAKNKVGINNQLNQNLTRKVNWYELLLITDGNGLIINDNNTIKATKGTVILRHPQMLTKIYPPYSRYIVTFDLNDLPAHHQAYKFHINRKKNLFKSNPYFTHNTIVPIDKNFEGSFVSSNFELYIELFENIYKEYLKSNVSNQFYLKANLLYLLSKVFEEKELLSYNSLSKAQIKDKKICNQVKEIINSNLSNKISLANICETLQIDKTLLCKIFKRTENTTITEYINIQRIILSKKLLIETNKPILQIAYECGFQNINYFYTTFKSKENITPQKYRLINAF